MEENKSYWARWYIGVLAFLVFQIILFYFISKQYA